MTADILTSHAMNAVRMGGVVDSVMREASRADVEIISVSARDSFGIGLIVTVHVAHADEAPLVASLWSGMDKLERSELSEGRVHVKRSARWALMDLTIEVVTIEHPLPADCDSADHEAVQP